MRVPDDSDARALTERTLGVKVATLGRFPRGLCHYVFDVTLADGRRVVARLAGPNSSSYLVGGIYWHKLLKPLGLPLPSLLHADLAASIPYVILERLPGRDLADAYSTMSREEKQALAVAVSDIQRRTSGLGEGRGFGFAFTLDDPDPRACSSWEQVMASMIARSRDRIVTSGIVNAEVVELVSRKIPNLSSYFASVRPVPFLPDTTTKNVLIHDRRLSGVVDIDEICFGDPLLTPALTKASLLASQQDTYYVTCWLDAVGVTGEARRAFDFYVAVFVLDFLSEQGLAFNREKSQANAGQIARLERLLRETLAAL